MPEIEVPDFFTPTQRQKKELESIASFFKRYWLYFVFAFFLLMFLSGAIVRVGAGERAIVFSIFGGVEKRVLGEGINFIVPFAQKATVYDIKLATYSFVTEDQNTQGLVVGEEIHSLTSDGQKVDVELTVRARPQPENLWRLHKLIGTSYPSKIIFPKARTILREVLATYPVEDVYSVKRQEIQNKIQKHLQEDLAKRYFVDVNEVLIRNVRFSKEFQDSIDRKQQAYQEYLKMEYVVAAEKTKKDAKVLQAEGEAKAINLRVNALRASPDFVKFRRAQVLGKRAKLIFAESVN